MEDKIPHLSKGKTMKKLFIIAIALFLGACAGKKPQPIDYTSPCACYEIIKYKG